MNKSKMTGQSTNLQAELLAKLMAEMPEIFSEGKIDTKKLKATLGEDVVTDQERYGLTWTGKTECFKKIQETTTNTLKPCRDESVDFDKTENLFIEGDNLQVLKVMQKSYYGKVKMIYIDPPYNTGNDFIYNDKFSRTKREELIANGSIDDDGNVVNHDLYRQNTRDGGHFHSNWLNMMYPRLFLARNLLKQDGVIFVSIDDNEVKNLRAMMDEIFGEENFFAQIIVRANSRGQTYKQIAKTHEYVLVYTRSPETDLNELEKDKESDDLNLNDEIGKFNIRELRNRNPKFGKHNRPNLFYPVYVNHSVIDKDGFSPISLEKENGYEIDVSPLNSEKKESCWRWGKSKFLQNVSKNTLKSNLIAKKKNDGSYGIYEKYRKTTYQPKSIWEDNNFLTETGTVEIRELGFGNSFDFPKPISLIKQCISLSTSEDDLVLDFFAGSGTTAQAVMQLNAEDGGNRKWICVQLPEKCKEESEAIKAGFVTIADIAKERIRRAGKKIKEGAKDKKLDFGFKAFKLDESNFKVWNTQIVNVEQLEQQLIDFIDNVRPESTTEDMLYELILKSGLELNVATEEKQVDGGKYHRIGDGSLIICLADKLTKPLFEAILKDNPEKIITLDRAFVNNDQLKTNMMLEAEHGGVKEFKVI